MLHVLYKLNFTRHKLYDKNIIYNINSYISKLSVSQKSVADKIIKNIKHYFENNLYNLNKIDKPNIIERFKNIFSCRENKNYIRFELPKTKSWSDYMDVCLYIYFIVSKEVYFNTSLHLSDHFVFKKRVNDEQTNFCVFYYNIQESKHVYTLVRRFRLKFISYE